MARRINVKFIDSLLASRNGDLTKKFRVKFYEEDPSANRDDIHIFEGRLYRSKAFKEGRIAVERALVGYSTLQIFVTRTDPVEESL